MPFSFGAFGTHVSSIDFLLEACVEAFVEIVLFDAEVVEACVTSACAEMFQGLWRWARSV